MKIVRSPLRISLGGGGTDLPSWYRMHGGFLITGAITKYIYFTGCERPFDRKFWMSYSKVEVTDAADAVTHDLLRKALEKYDLPRGMEIHSISEVPGNSGLGSSGAFVVGALTLLNAMKKIEVTRQSVAELGCRIEMEELKRASGKQDQYAAAMGGIMTLEISKTGEVRVKPLALDPAVLKQLQYSLLLFYTGKSRDANEVLADQGAKLAKGDATTAMKRIQEIGYESRDCLVKGELDQFGKLLHTHWEVKKTMAAGMSSSALDQVYDVGIQAGALGGKILGAGGGGYFMFYAPADKQAQVRAALAQQGLVEMDWKFDFDGCTVVYAG